MTDISLVVKITLVLAAALGLRACLRRAPAAARALLLTAALAVVALLPLAAVVIPVVAVPFPAAATRTALQTTAPPARVVMPVFEVPPDASVAPPASTAPLRTTRITITTMVALLWAVGTLACLLPLLPGLLHTRRVHRRATAQPLPPALARWQNQLGRFRLLVSDEVYVPMACGVLTPAVILPRDATGWPAGQIDNAVLHEAEHLRRQDWLVFLSARCICALYWWHPLVWAAWRRLRVDAEHACDDAVVQRMDRVAYAEQLVSLAQQVADRRTAPLIAMARNTDLARRVTAILDATRNRRTLSPTWAVWALGLALVACLGIAPLQVAQAQGRGDASNDLEPQRRAPLGAPAGHFAGVVLDPTGVPVPGLLLIVGPQSCQSETERPNCSFRGTWERTDRQGRFRFERLPVGRFYVTSQVDYFPGMEFSIEQDATVEHVITMKVLPVEAEFTICTECPAPVVPDSLAKELAADAAAALDDPVSAPRPASGWDLYMPGMGIYPPDLASAGVEGSVVIEGIIGVDGVPANFKVDVAADRRLAQAAMAALSAEIWEPGRIRGTAVEVPFRFLIRYSVSGRGTAQAAIGSAPVLAFEASSVKRSTDPDALLGIQPTAGGRFKAIATVQMLIQVAYGTPGAGALFEAQLVGLPAWARDDRFEINAVFDGPVSTTPGDGADRLLAMLRWLLEGRFDLRLRKETRQLPTYDLVLDRADGRLGPRLTRADGSCLTMTPDSGPITDFTRYCGFKQAGPNTISARGLSLASLAGTLAFNADVQRAVRDRTGLSGTFDLDVAYVPMNASAQTGVSLFTALREQLGLALRSSTGPVEVFVVEHVQPPTLN